MKTTFGKIDITPLTPQYVCGHAMRIGKSLGVHDPLELSILWLEIENKKMCIINADLIMASFNFCDEIRDSIAEKYHIDRELVIFTVTHTHSGPNFGDVDAMMMAGDVDYIAYVKKQLYLLVDQTTDKLQDFNHVICHKGLISGYYGNRNDVKKDGDKLAYFIEFKQNEETITALANLSCHSTVNNPLELNISADLLGNVKRQLKVLTGIEPLITNGNAGDMSNRQYRHGNGWEELEQISKGIAKQIQEFDDITEIELGTIHTNIISYQVDYERDSSNISAELAKLKSNLVNENNFDAKKWLYSEIAGYEYKLKYPKVNICLDGEVIRLKDLELVIIPCELASNFGLQIKKSSTAKVCIVIGYANGSATYVVEACEFSSGHDGIATDLKRGQAEEYVGKIIQKMF